MGVINVTPDSFSDGGQFAEPGTAVARGRRLVDEGAHILDVGGESTRPQGAVPVGEAEELRRVLPFVREARRRWPETVLSVDTVKSAIAAAVLDEGADVINDVSALRLDERMADVCAARGAGVILMHSRGTVADMGTYQHATYGARVTDEVHDELRDRVRVATAAGIPAARIAVDPGIGFSKRSEHSLALLADLPRLAAWGHPVLVGVSRKRFIGEITGVTNPSERVMGTVGANVTALTLGARLFRVHDVRASREALDVAWAILRAGAGAGAERDA